ncbi:MAG: trigger factor [Helicobacteraceae bacterium]|jgi:trigger factor|nr:trigger factor [Helicobacteraceae bacterium]
MAVSLTKINSANALISASITKEAIAKAQAQVSRKIASDVKIDGFRKGKVPLSVIKARFGDRLEENVRALLAQEAFEEGIKQLENPRLIGMPIVSEVKEHDDGLDMKMKVSLRPPIDLGDYLSIVPISEPILIGEQELADTLQKAADSTIKAEEITEERALQKGDIAVFDFAGYMDESEMENGSAKNYEMTIGSGAFIPGFEDQMIGMAKGETKRVNITFPEHYHVKKIAGKAAEFEVTLNAIKTKKSATLDDEIAKKLLPNVEDANIEKLKDAVKQSLINDRRAKLYNEELRPKLLNALAEKYSFDLPEIIVEQEIDHLATQKARTMDEESLQNLYKDSEALKAFREEFRQEAVDRVRTTLIVDEIAKAESITVSDHEVTQSIYYEAMQIGQDPKDMLKYYRANNLIPVVRMSLTEDRVLTRLLDKKNGDQKEAA